MSGSDIPPRLSGRAEGTTYNLLFVCSGNTCRSPMAEAITRSLLRERGWKHVDVASAGTGAVTGSSASPEAVVVARERGLELDGHTSQPLTPELIGWADLVLVMGPSHMYAVRELGGAEKVSLVTAFVDGDGHAEPVADPFGGDEELYREAFAQIEEAVASLLERLEPILAP
ncbi:MAG: low molecular weight protein arginine phosphatase [Gemmatimonadetes bacterium]|nr:low molecular weight protein arginine phosphatase [Gemmatimonadota bacterium]